MKGYSLPGEGRRRNKVRIQQETYEPRATHSLEDRKGRDKSGHRNNPTGQGPLTDWRPHRVGQVRTQKESNRPRPTHSLKTAQGGTSQNTERIRSTEAHSHTGDRTGRDKSGHGKNTIDRGQLTLWRPHREGQVRTREESDRPRPTHQLETTGRDKLGHGKNPTDRGPLTSWRPHREGQVRTRKESNRPRPTHQLETAQGGTSQDTERNRSTKANSPTGDRTGRGKSGHGKNPTD